MVENALFYVGVKALIQNEKAEILLLKSGRKKPKVLKQKEAFWDIPGGKMKVGDDLLDALKREVKEELDEEIEVGELFGVVKSNFRDENTKNLFLLLVIYKAKLKNTSQPKLSWEHSEYKWVRIGEARKLLSFKYPKEFIERLDALK